MAECEQLRSLNAQLLASKKQLEERARASDVGLVELVSQIKQDATDRANNRIRDVHLEWQAKLEAARQEWNADKQQEMARLVKVPNRRSPRTQAFAPTVTATATHTSHPPAQPQVDMRAHTSAPYGSLSPRGLQRIRALTLTAAGNAQVAAEGHSVAASFGIAIAADSFHVSYGVDGNHGDC
jgi:hypothetical protein